MTGSVSYKKSEILYVKNKKTRRKKKRTKTEV